MAARPLPQWPKNYLQMSIAKYIFMAACLFVVASCDSRQAADKPILAVSIEPQRQILEKIAGPDFEVTTLLGRGADPETFDPSTAQRLAVDEADIYFSTGVLPFESKIQESIAKESEFVDTSKGMTLLYGTHGHAHVDSASAPDPHYWSSVIGATAIARNMAEALKKRYPERAVDINLRLDDFYMEMAELNRRIAAKLEKAKNPVFAVWHPSLSYFARDYGLEQLSLGEEGKELSAKDMAEAIDHAKADKVTVFFFQPGIDSRQAEVLNESIGSRLVSINPLDYNWQGQLLSIADEIARP